MTSPEDVPRDVTLAFLIEALAEASGPQSARELGDRVNARLIESKWWPDAALSRTETERVLQAESGRIFSAGVLGGWTLTAPRERLVDATLPKRGAARDGSLYRWQREALQAWRAAGRRGIVEAVTGAGKTRLGIAAIDELIRRPGDRVAILVPTVELLHQWAGILGRTYAAPIGLVGGGRRDALVDFPIAIYVARSAADVLPADVEDASRYGRISLIADECHRYGAETYANALTAACSATLGLSATPERQHDDGMREHVFPKLGPVVYAFNHAEAIRAGVVADFSMIYVGVPFERSERSEFDELSARIASAWTKIAQEHPDIAYASFPLNIVKLLASQDDDAARRYLALIAARQRLVTSGSQRHAFVAWLAAEKFFEGRRTLLFHESIADCEAVATLLRERGVRTASHHSQLALDERENALIRFRRGEIAALAAPRTLDEGIDVPDADTAIIVAGTRVRRQTIQRIGRVVRRSPGKGHAAVVRLFVSGALDDPRRVGGDAFAKQMIEKGQASLLEWPERADSIWRRLGDRRR